MKNIILLFITIFTLSYTAPLKGDRVEIREPVSGNIVSSSERLIVDAQVDGTIISASKYIDINSRSRGVVAAAADITINDDIDSLLVSASRSLTVNGRVGDSIIAACESMLLTGSAGDVVVAAREVDITGDINNLYAAADKIFISGRVRGDVYTTTNKIEFIGDGAVLGKVHYPKIAAINEREENIEKKLVKKETMKKGFHFFRIGVLIHSLMGILIISLILKKALPEMTERLSKTLFKRGFLAFFIGLFLIVTIPVFIVLTIPFFGVYSMMLISGYIFIFILSKSFLVAALSIKYNYFLSLLVIAGLSYNYFFSIAFSILGFGIFLLFMKEELFNK